MDPNITWPVNLYIGNALYSALSCAISAFSWSSQFLFYQYLYHVFGSYEQFPKFLIISYDLRNSLEQRGMINKLQRNYLQFHLESYHHIQLAKLQQNSAMNTKIIITKCMNQQFNGDKVNSSVDLPWTLEALRILCDTRIYQPMNNDQTGNG